MRHRGSCGLAVVLIGALALAGGAEAKPLTQKRKVITRTAQATGSGNASFLTATATCPKKTRATGGGFSLPTPSGYLPLMYESRKVGQTAWRASVQIADLAAPLDTVTITASVYCRKGAPNTSTVAATVAAPMTAMSHFGPVASAACPGNRRLVAGGFSTEPPLVGSTIELLMVRTEPAGNIWITDVLSGNGDSALTSYAYCERKKSTGGPIPVAAAVQGTVPAPMRTTATSSCARNRTIVGGGFSQTYVAGTGYYFPIEARRAGNSWITSGIQAGPTTLVSLRSVGLCAPTRVPRP